ncbi:M20 family metallopeptidase [Candidatus Merdisoma sp. JLR.KK006]|uniref:M20 metallopeptidase family protein n=1 Tax=Candidatus Merdisoma sp. JLR.KK006 TaxID=3112626 RepID=UPI001434B68C|nr:hippurate hydrolase [Lachnospiraceae bacterium]
MLKQWIEEHQELEREIIEHRHYLHQHPEIGSKLPLTSKYVYDTLVSYGYQPIKMAVSGMYVLVGKPSEKTLLLRADMDGLPMKEETNEPFKSKNQNMHSCGHDMHTGMMLGVAKLLKEQESQLKGCIKIMFQPHEEGLVGAANMIKEGILENPKVDAALAVHVEAGMDDSGILRYRKKETTAASTIFEITVTGKSAHGAQPHLGIDPINVAVRIYLGFQELIARELPASSTNVLTVGMLHAGSSHNIVPETAFMKCSLRSFCEEEQRYILKRAEEISSGIAAAYGAKVKIEEVNSAPCTYNDPALTEEIIGYSKEIFKESLQYREKPLPVSEDFSRISEQVPSCFVTLAAGSPQEGYCYPQHNPKVTFDEGVMIKGCFFLYHSAVQWLLHHNP